MEEGELTSRHELSGVSLMLNKALPPDPIPRSSFPMRRTWIPLAMLTVQLKPIELNPMSVPLSLESEP